jgi:hypothetical protein
MLSKKIKEYVLNRANSHCEYCLLPSDYSSQPFVCEHIIPLIKDGTNEYDNLALSCGGCNGHKYDKIEAIDPLTNILTPLYNPRTMQWQEHFKWSSDYFYMLPITDIGRATIETLKLNRKGVVNVRQLLILVHKHPPII